MCLEVGDTRLGGKYPNLLQSQHHPFNTEAYDVIDVNFFAIVNINASRLGEFSAAEEGLVGQGRDNIYCARGLTDRVVEFSYGKGWGAVAVCYGTKFGGNMIHLNIRV